MSKLYVLASVSGQGKTTTILLLEKYFRSQGLKVACLQALKGEWDVGLYLKNNCYHYSIPIEAAKSRSDLERWLPLGYDIYIMEISYPYISPVSTAYISLFNNVNEVISYQVKDRWKEYILERYGSLPFWDGFYKRNVKKVVTRVPHILQSPCVDDKFKLHNPEKIIFEQISPKMKFPMDDKTVIAVGAFPAEFWDIFPHLKWYGYDYPSFMKRYREEDYDLAIIGACTNNKMRFSYKPKQSLIFCYHPVVYINNLKDYRSIPINTDLKEIYSGIKRKPLGSQLGMEGCLYASLNNKFWIFQKYSGLDLITVRDNLIICNGWVLPQYLIREGYLEV